MRSRTLALVLIGALLVGVVALWGLGRGSADAAPLTARAGEYTVRLTLDRWAVGPQEVVVAIEDGAGRPFAAEEVTLLAVMAEMGHVEPVLHGEPEAPGRWRMRGEVFSMTGEWEVDVGFLGGGARQTARFAVTVG